MDLELCVTNALCRTCLREADVSVDIFSKKQSSLLQMLVDFAHIKIAADDQLPEKVCNDCRDLIVSCYNFKMLCENSDTALRELTGKSRDRDKELAASPPCSPLSDNSDELKCDISNKESHLERSSGTVHGTSEETYLLQSTESQCSYYDQILSLASNTSESETPVVPVEIHDYCEVTIKDIKQLKVHTNVCNNVDNSTVHEDVDSSDLSARTNESGIEMSDVESTDNTADDFNNKASEAVFLNPNCRCRQCGKIFRSAGDLRRHEAKHDPRKPYHCTVGRCKWSFESLSALLVHGDLNHAPAGAALACRACGNTYRHARSLRQHLLNHAQPKRFACQYCQKGFTLRHHLKAHENTHSNEKPFLCQQCGAFFATKERLQLHMRRHSEPRQHRCTVCSKTFISSYNLKLHMNVHSEERAYMCAECGRQFRSKRSLVRHNARHAAAAAPPYPTPAQNEPAKYLCIICKRDLRKSSTLDRHMRTHLSGERSFKCESCSWVFTRASHLRVHATRRHRSAAATRTQNAGRAADTIMVTADGGVERVAGAAAAHRGGLPARPSPTIGVLNIEVIKKPD